MRVSVVINPRAGSVLIHFLRRKIEEALFRCDIKFYFSHIREDYIDFLEQEIRKGTQAFLICGGDGTVNETLQVLMTLRGRGYEIPPLSLIQSGTANDLAFEMGVSKRVDRAARLLFEGEKKLLDVISVSSGEVTKYMLTNGGIGIPSQAALLANEIRSYLQTHARDENSSLPKQLMGLSFYRAVKSFRSEFYSMLLATEVLRWKDDNWGLEIESEDLPEKLHTRAPFILVNNQPVIGGNHLVAPFTQNSDGTVNLSYFEATNLTQRLSSALRVKLGSVVNDPTLKSFELHKFKIRSQKDCRSFSFFGDGELLLNDVAEANIECLPKSVLVFS